MTMVLRLYVLRLLALVLVTLGWALPAFADAPALDPAPAKIRPALLKNPDPGFITLCYHEVVASPTASIVADAEPVLLTELTDQFDWLRQNGYNVIGVDDIIVASRGGKPLPPKAVLLSFDDGYVSFYNMVFPLLKAYKYKAMLALETTWLETPETRPVDYGGTAILPRTNFLTWSQAKEMADSGVVELASHSHNLHRAHLSTPQGVSQPSAGTLAYDPKTNTYETLDAYRRRVKEDIAKSADIIQRHTGHRPRVMVWPYGRYTQVAVQAARDAGYLLTASLGFYADWPTFPRQLMYEGANFPELMASLEDGRESGSSRHDRMNFNVQYPKPFAPTYPLQRVMHVDIDTVYDPDPAQQDKNVSALFDRIMAMGISVVYLQAYADPDGNGTADALYFPSRHLPMRADLFNYLSWQIATRLRVRVYAWMPVLGFEVPGRPLVEAVEPSKAGSPYKRLTPFDSENRRIIREIYQDLAQHSAVVGLLFHDDAILGDYEDVSPAGRAWLRSQGLPEDPMAIRADAELMRRFTQAKTAALSDFTDELTAAMRTWSAPLFTARNLYARVVLEPESEAWYGQNYADFLTRYDYTGLMAMPYMEGAAGSADTWLKRLTEKVREYPLGARKTVFELQAVDWRSDHRGPISSKILAEQMELLHTHGIGNYGYYPENPVTGHPDIKVLYPYFSLHANPYLVK